MAGIWDDAEGSDFNDASWTSGANFQDHDGHQGVPIAQNEASRGNHDEGHSDDLCRRCQQPGHFARDCTEPRSDIACHNCGGPHMAKECDQPKAKSCRLCKGEHDTIDCKTPYPLDMGDVPDLAEDQCWQMMKQASDDSDVDDFKDAMKALQKACPEITYPALEKQLRSRNLKFHLIALEKDIGEGYTNVNMQGEASQKFAVAVFRSASCPRPNLLSKWPKDIDENLSRLTEAGITLTRGLDHCRRCDNYGHISKDCTEERVEIDGPKVVCALCSEEGHRVRDCTQPRQKAPRTCKRCGDEGHIAKECHQPEPVQTCRNCGEEGHISKECEKTICRNCDKEGHVSKDCTEPKDWSRVVCRHCGEKGHASASRCKPGVTIVAKGESDAALTTNGTPAAVSIGYEGFKDNTLGYQNNDAGWNGGTEVTSGSLW